VHVERASFQSDARAGVGTVAVGAKKDRVEMSVCVVLIVCDEVRERREVEREG
jgi:hypothetical protein